MGTRCRAAKRAAVATAAAIALLATPLAPIASAHAATLRCSGVISGTITSTGGRPVANVAVFVDVDRSDGPYEVTVKTSSTGTYRVGSVCSGTAWIEAANDERWWLPTTRTLTTRNGVTNTASFTVEPAGELLVKVANESDFRHPNIRIKGVSDTSLKVDAWSNQFSGADVAMSGGRAILYRVPIGRYRVTAYPGAKKLRITIQGTNSREVEVVQYKRTAASFAIDKGGALKGKVTPKPKRDPDGQRGYVTVKSSLGFRAQAPINKYGNYTIKNLPPGTYKVHFWIARTTTDGRDWRDYYRAGKKKVKTLAVKQGKTLKLRTTKLKGKSKGSPYLYFEP